MYGSAVVDTLNLMNAVWHRKDSTAACKNAAMTEKLVPHMQEPDHASESSVDRLYRAAVGPVHADYYLSRFSRFEQSGRAGLSWNWAAGLLTLNWLIFRQLWLQALVYTMALLMLPLLVLGLGRLLLQVPHSVELGLWLACLVASLVVPGAWGNAVFFGQCKERIAQALETTTTLDAACQRLLLQSSNKKRALWLGLINAAVLGLAAWAYASFAPVPEPEEDQMAGASPVAAVVKPPAAARAFAPTSAPTSAPVLASASAAASASLPSTATTSAAAVTTSTTSAVTAASSAAAASLLSAPASASVTLPVSAPAAWSRPVSAAEPVQPSRAAVAASLPVARPSARATSPAQQTVSVAQLGSPATAASVAERASPNGTAAPAKLAVSKPAASKPVVRRPVTPTSGAAKGQVFINVGLFADADNARNAYVKLVKSGLPAERLVLIPAEGSGKAKLTRVRCGPFDSRAQARAAVAQIKALQLDAVLAP